MSEWAKKELQLKIFQLVIFGPATWFLFFKGQYYPASFYETWQPISFYKIFSSPISNSLLQTVKWLWFILSAFTVGFSWKDLSSLRTKIFTIFACLCGVFYLGHFYNFGTVYHGTHLYTGICLILAFAPEGENGNIWKIQLIKAFVVFMLFSAGMGKLLRGGFSWVFSESLFYKLVLLPSHTPLAELLLTAPLWFIKFLAFWILFVVQLSSPTALIQRRLGILYFFIWTTFHIGGTLIFSVGSTFYSHIFCYLIFLPLSDWYLQLREKLSSRMIPRNS